MGPAMGSVADDLPEDPEEWGKEEAEGRTKPIVDAITISAGTGSRSQEYL